MARRALPALLVLVALIADLTGRHGLALATLLLAIPVAFALALDCYGAAIEGRCGGGRPMLAGLALLLVVLSAALRSPAVVGGVPQLALSTLVGSLLLYGGIAVAAALPLLGRLAPAASRG